MKITGSTFEYEEERNNDLIRAYRKELCNVTYIRMPDIYRAVVNRPSKRFWVSEERTGIVISNMFKGDQLEGMRPTKREMFFEIFDRVKQMLQDCPHLSLQQIIFKVLRQPAPKFYLTPGSAKTIVSKIKRKWYEQRKKTLRHTF